jgi:hypothetical protein
MQLQVLHEPGLQALWSKMAVHTPLQEPSICIRLCRNVDFALYTLQHTLQQELCVCICLCRNVEHTNRLTQLIPPAFDAWGISWQLQQ